jgi:hypothetical protein
MSTNPSQKDGIESQKIAKNIDVLSTHEYCFTALTTPSGNAMRSVITNAASASSSVAGSRSIIRVATGRPD